MNKQTLQQLKDRFIKFGRCIHDERFYEISNPYNCNVELTTCGVCNKIISKVYLC